MANYQHTYEVMQQRDDNVVPINWHTYDDLPYGKYSDSMEDESSRIPAINPVYVIPYDAVVRMQKWSTDNPLRFG